MRRLWWCATTDMAADGLNKGSIARAQLLAVARDGAWFPKLPLKMFQEAKRVPVVSCGEFAKTRAAAGTYTSILDYEFAAALSEAKIAV